MKATLKLLLIGHLLAALGLSAHAQGTAFTYQGRLNDGVNPASGVYDLRFAIYDSASAGAQQGGTLTNASTAVSNGLFTATLDFGNQFPGTKRWLEIAARTNGGTAFISLSPRQPITSAPYAVTAGSVSGGVPDAQLPVTIPRLSLGNTFTAPQTLSGTAQSMLNLNSSNTGGTWLNLANSDTGGKTWNLISSATANGEGPGKLLIRDASYGVVLTLSSNGNVGIGTTSPGNPLDVTAAGTTNGGVAGFPEVVAHFRRSPGAHSAVAIDSAVNQDGVLYFSEGGSPVWGLRHDSQPEHDFQLRYHAGGANTPMLTVSTNGDVGIGTAAPAARLDVNGSIRAGGGIVFPDGSSQYRATDPSPLTASGLPQGSTFTVTIGGTAATLSSAYVLDHAIQQNPNDAGGGYVYSTAYAPQPIIPNVFKVRRPRTADQTWLNWTALGTTRALSMQLSVPGGSTVTWTGNVYVVQHDLVQSAGTLFEELSLGASRFNLLTRAVSGSPTVSAPTGELPGVALALNGSFIQNIAFITPSTSKSIAFDVGLGAPIGLTKGPVFTIRANPFSNQILYPRFITADNQADTATLSSGGTTLATSQSKFYTHYALRLADDGLPIEEFTLALNPF